MRRQILGFGEWMLATVLSNARVLDGEIGRMCVQNKRWGSGCAQTLRILQMCLGRMKIKKTFPGCNSRVKLSVNCPPWTGFLLFPFALPA